MTPFDRVLTAVALGLVRLFYREIAVSGAPPGDGPIILVANHPNGLLDPAVLRIAVDRPVAFLAKSTLFANPVARACMFALGAIPVYRAKEADTAKNEETFSRCRALLRDRGWLALFPEGISHDEPELQPLKTGAARIALSSGAEGLRVVPAGILYEEKEVFRSRVAVAFGAPIEVPPGEEGPTAVQALTARIADALGDVVLQAEDQEMWRGLVAVARWTSPEGADLATVDRRARELAAGMRALSERDPERLDAIVAKARRFVRVLDSVGVRDPFAVEGPPVSPLRAVLPLVLLAPIALFGAVLAWVPYRLVKPLSHRLAGGHVDIVGTIKALVGAAILTVVWIGWAVAAGVAFGPWAGLGMLVVGPLSGLVALRWGERLDLRREALRGGWLRTSHASLAAAVAERRRELAALVQEGLAAVDGGESGAAP